MLNTTEKQTLQGEAIFYIKSIDHFALDQTG